MNPNDDDLMPDPYPTEPEDDDGLPDIATWEDTHEQLRIIQATADRLRPDFLRIKAQNPHDPPSPEDVVLLMEMCDLYWQDWTVGLSPTGSPNEILATKWIRSFTPGSKMVLHKYRVEEVTLNGRKVFLPYHQGPWKRLVLALVEPFILAPRED